MVLETQPCWPGVMPSELGHWLPPAFPSVLSSVIPHSTMVLIKGPSKETGYFPEPRAIGKNGKMGVNKAELSKNPAPLLWSGRRGFSKILPKDSCESPIPDTCGTAGNLSQQNQDHFLDTCGRFSSSTGVRVC